MMRPPALYTIPPDRPFARDLARGILAMDGAAPDKLSRRLILLPTRRACRAVREAFLAETNGAPLLLPRLQALGDVDAEELFLSSAIDGAHAIPPAIPSLRRALLLAQLIAAREGSGFQPERHIALAKVLGRLMDQIYTENLSLADLPRLVDGTDFAEHWQITVSFLTILSKAWPEVLAAEGMIDAADRRNRLLLALAAHWESHPPDFPVVAAGSTGSIPATAHILGVISRLPRGAVVLPGLDQVMDEQDWADVEDGHPQATLKQLLRRLDCTRSDVRLWGAADDAPSLRVRLASELMRPAATAEQWQRLTWPANDIETALSGLSLIEADTAQEEADAIALLLRETLETPHKTALVVTPDRTLARRVMAAMEKWDVTLDDSAGRPLFQTETARFFLGIAETAANFLKPAGLLAVLKHPLCRQSFSAGFAARLEMGLLRGIAPPPGPDGLLAHFMRKSSDPKQRFRPCPALHTDIERLKKIMSPFYALMQEPDAVPLDKLIESHIAVAEQLAAIDTLWAGEAGQALARFLSDLRIEAGTLPPIVPSSYPALLRALIAGHTVRPAYGTHPRLAIMGQLEARLVQADRLILAGLNEGVWPPETGADPFLSRPMKRDFGLPPAERAIGLAAHDFVQGFCAQEVYLTRARQINGTPAIPARWLSRLETVLHALNTTLPDGQAVRIHSCLSAMNAAPPAEPAGRPAPKPDPSLRPKRLSVTKIETWLKDPYAIYAQYVLKLDRMKPLEQVADAASRGSFIHAVLEEWVAMTADSSLGPDAEHNLLSLARRRLPDHIPDVADQALLWPRIVRWAGWLAEQERVWRTMAVPAVREIHTAWSFDAGGHAFTLSGIADRIDHLKEGGAAIIDYKSGGATTYTAAAIASGKLPQLPLEALMLRKGAFAAAGIPPVKTGTLSYWVVSGGTPPGTVHTLSDSDAIEAAVDAVEQALYALVETYADGETPYIASPSTARVLRFNDYAHLARIQEWIAPDHEDEAA